MIRVCKSIAGGEDDYLSLYDTLPTLAVTEQMSKMMTMYKSREESVKNDQCQKRWPYGRSLLKTYG